MRTIEFKFSIGDLVLVSFDTEAKPKTIVGIYIESENVKYLVSNFKESQYVEERFIKAYDPNPVTQTPTQVLESFRL